MIYVIASWSEDIKQWKYLFKLGGWPILDEAGVRARRESEDTMGVIGVFKAGVFFTDDSANHLRAYTAEFQWPEILFFAGQELFTKEFVRHKMSLYGTSKWVSDSQRVNASLSDAMELSQKRMAMFGTAEMLELGSMRQPITPAYLEADLVIEIVDEFFCKPIKQSNFAEPDPYTHFENRAYPIGERIGWRGETLFCFALEGRQRMFARLNKFYRIADLFLGEEFADRIEQNWIMEDKGKG